MSPARPFTHRRRPSIASSSRDLAMLRIAPIDSPPLPRAHVSHRRAMAAFRLHDRPSGEDVVVYTPMYRSQFDAGHRAGRWYVRSATSVGGVPSSVAFATAKEAIDAVGGDSWRLQLVARDGSQVPARECARPRLRVIWSPSDPRD